MKSRFLSFKIVVFILLAGFYAASGAEAAEPAKEWKEWESKQDVPLLKIWTIHLNERIDPDTVNSESVLVENAARQPVPVQLSLSESGSSIVIKPPAQGYEKGETYTLYITSEVESETGSLLVEPVRMNFTTDSEKDVFEPRETSTHTVSMTDQVKEVDESSVLRVDGAAVEVETGAGPLQAGDIFFLPPTQEAPFGEARKVVSTVPGAGSTTVNTTAPTADEVISTIDLSEQIPVSGDDFILNPDLLSPSAAGSRQTQAFEGIDTISFGDEGFEIVFKDFELEKLHTTISGSLNFAYPHVNLDIEPLTVLGIPYGLEFNRLEFKAKETLDLHVSASGGKGSQEILLGEAPVPFAGYPKAGINIRLYLVVYADGGASLEYSFEQTFDAKVGVKHNKQADKLEAIKDLDFTMDASGIELTGEAQMGIGLQTGMHALIGNLSIADLSVSLDAGNHFEGKRVDFSEEDNLSPAACYRFGPEVTASGHFTLGKEVETKLFKFDMQYEKELFHKELFSETVGNCSYKKIQLLPNIKSVKPGEQQDLYVQGTALDWERTIENIRIPNEYITFTSENPDVLTVNRRGEMSVSRQVDKSERVDVTASWTDPITDKTISDKIVISVGENKVKHESDLLEYSILVDKSVMDKLVIQEEVFEDDEYGDVWSEAFYYKDETLLHDNVYVGSIARYSHRQWDEYYSAFPDTYEVEKTKHWVYALSGPLEHPYLIETGEMDSPAAKEYSVIFEKLTEAFQETLDLFPTEVPDPGIPGFSSPYPYVSLKDRNGRQYEAGIFSNDMTYEPGEEDWYWWSKAYSGTFKLALKEDGGLWQLQQVSPFGEGDTGTFYNNETRNESYMFYTVPGSSGSPDLLVITQPESYSDSIMQVFYIHNGKLSPVSFSLPEQGKRYGSYIHVTPLKANGDGTFQSDDYDRATASWTYYTWFLDEDAGLLQLLSSKTISGN